MFKNKTDEKGTVTCNKTHLVAQSYAQIEGVNFSETFAHVARLEAIQLILRFACINQVKLYQMDVKSAFLNAFLKKYMLLNQRALSI